MFELNIFYQLLGFRYKRYQSANHELYYICFRLFTREIKHTKARNGNKQFYSNCTEIKLYHEKICFIIFSALHQYSSTLKQ